MSNLLKNTIPIVYGAGSYGTFIEWCLNYFSGSSVIANPIRPNGSSHAFTGNLLVDMDGWRSYLKNGQFLQFVRLHPKVTEYESVIDNILEITQVANRSILLYYDLDSILLQINNKFDKVRPETHYHYLQQGTKENLKGWGKNKLEDMEFWELREFISLFTLPQHLAENEIDKINKFTHPKVLKVNIKDLFEDFENTIKILLNWCRLEIKNSDYDKIFKMWESAQIHRYKDKLVKKIVNSVISNLDFEWGDTNLSIVDEAFIQMQLRDLYNMQLKCYNLNVFPKNSTALRNIIE